MCSRMRNSEDGAMLALWRRPPVERLAGLRVVGLVERLAVEMICSGMYGSEFIRVRCVRLHKIA